MKTVSTSHGRSRGCLVWLGRMSVFVGGVMLLGAIYESMAEASDYP